MSKDLQTQMMEYLDCPCRYFAPMEDDAPLREAYQEAQSRSAAGQFTPVFVAIDDTLWEALVMSVCENDDFRFDLEQVRAYRNKQLSSPLRSGTEVLHERLLAMQELSETTLQPEEAVPVQAEDQQIIDGFSGYWDYATRRTQPLLLAEIPTKNPWEIFAWLPFGGWNECPDTPDLMAVSQYWFTKYQAVPAVITHDVLEFLLPQPVSEQDAPTLALEQYVWCPDTLDGSDGNTLGTLARLLLHSAAWFFWWD